MQNVIRVLLNKNDIKLRALAKESNTPLGVTVKNTKALEKIRYIEKKVNIKVINPTRLLKAWSYTTSIRELEKIEFTAAERPQFIIKKISSILSKNNIKHAFTLFSATEILSPYVTPSETHLYILEKDKERINKLFKKESILPAQKGNIICFIADENYFYNMQNINNYDIISTPQLYVDLFSYGGRGEDAAQNLLEAIKNVWYLRNRFVIWILK